VHGIVTGTVIVIETENGDKEGKMAAEIATVHGIVSVHVSVVE